MQYHWPKGYCPFGCHNADPELGIESQFDVNGYCCHLVGTLNLAPGAKAIIGTKFETLEPIMVPVYDETDRPIVDEIDGKKVPRLTHSGNMRSNGKKKGTVQAGDIVVDAATYQLKTTYTETQTDVTGAVHETVRRQKLGIAARVYRPGANVQVMTKPQEDDQAQGWRNKAEDLMLQADEALAKASAIDKAREPSEVDEEAVALAAGKAERKRMKEKEFAGQQ